LYFFVLVLTVRCLFSSLSRQFLVFRYVAAADSSRLFWSFSSSLALAVACCRCYSHCAFALLFFFFLRVACCSFFLASCRAFLSRFLIALSHFRTFALSHYSAAGSLFAALLSYCLTLRCCSCSSQVVLVLPGRVATRCGDCGVFFYDRIFVCSFITVFLLPVLFHRNRRRLRLDTHDIPTIANSVCARSVALSVHTHTFQQERQVTLAGDCHQVAFAG